ncbi:MAG TPA: nucleoside triphosphate pyrophosphatase [Conexibacter sp.]|nr:nucleoside triphosphate pyrophosphatase [Conexibacter sp.]
MTQLVLASRSPQRRAILEQLGVAFDVVVSDAEELSGGSDPVAVAVENARRKAQAVWRAGPADPARPDDPAGQPRESSSPAPPARSAATADAASPWSPLSLPVVGVDTLVTLDGALYGKPADAAAARDTLSRLSGRTHEVVSGVAVVEAGETRTASATTRVAFRALGAETLDWYLATEEWRERAGGYAIQGRGAALVQRIEGDYLNVVGLPVQALLGLLPGILHGAS